MEGQWTFFQQNIAYVNDPKEEQSPPTDGLKSIVPTTPYLAHSPGKICIDP